MPELPEVETMCRCIAAAVGCRICDVQRPKTQLQSILIAPRLDHFRRRAVGRRIVGIRRVGKRVVLELDGGTRRVRETHQLRTVRKDTLSATTGLDAGPHPSPLPKGEGTFGLSDLPKGEGTFGGGDCIVMEPRMTGLVLLADPPDRKHLRLVFRLSRDETGTGTSREACPTPSSHGSSEPVPVSSGPARQILFWDQRGLGVARFLSAAQFAQDYGLDRLGPDALTISPETLRQRLKDSRRAIKVALLDQHAVAGIGNLYASEILHHAGIHPAIPCCRLRPAQWSKLHAAIGVVLQAAIRHQGSTLRDGTYRIARNTPGDYQVFHRVYQRAEEHCLGCRGGRIVRIVQAQRSTFFCPVCQRPCGSNRSG